jgi:hypothetical protein
MHYNSVILSSPLKRERPFPDRPTPEVLHPLPEIRPRTSEIWSQSVTVGCTSRA